MTALRSRRGGVAERAEADREVILSAGRFKGLLSRGGGRRAVRAIPFAATSC
jgi:hypothetical protein